MKKHALLISFLIIAACSNQPSTLTITPESKPAYPVSSNSQPMVDRQRPPDSAYRNPGSVDRLLDGSSELVTIGLDSRGALNEMSRIATDDPPTRVDLNCSPKDALCTESKMWFSSRGIPVSYVGDGDDVTLIYERVVARDCDNRFVDNFENNYNQNHPAFGCSVVGNTVQMVSDKRQFTNPSLMDLQDGNKAVQTYRRYRQPPAPSKEGRSLLKTITTQ